MKKIILSLIFIFTLTMTLFAVSAGAFEIDTTDVDIVLNENGDAYVTEKWTVTYLDSEDYFYRDFDIYTSDSAVSLVQKYGEIKDVQVRIDSEKVQESNSVNGYSFAMAEDGKSYVLAIKCPSAQQVREYEISYTITDAVKKSGGEAVFAYMFIGKTFRYTSNNVIVDVEFPDGVKATDIKVPEGYDKIGCEVVVNENSASFEKDRVYDTFSVEASCDKEFFQADSMVKYSAFADKAGAIFKGFLKILPYVIAVFAAVLIVLFVLLPDRLARFSLEKKVRKELKADNEKKFAVPENKTACECYKLLKPASRINPVSTAKRIPALFALAILECMEFGYIIEEDEKLIVGTPKKDVPAYIASVLNFLKSFCTQKGNRYIIDKDFAERVVAECEIKYDVITNYLSTFYSLIEGERLSFFMKKENKEFYKSVYTLEKYAEDVKSKPSFSECAELVLTGGKTTDADIFAMMYTSSPDKIFAKSSGTKGEKELCEALAAMYKVFIKSK